MALVAGIGVGLFVLILFGVLAVVGCYFASATSRAPLFIGAITAAYVIMLIVLLFSPKQSEVGDTKAETTDSRTANTYILMAALALTAVISIIAVCTNYLATPITAKAI
mmetsp:Transcript_20820/g.53713  ORF Transcript_20820/g.53713 Transcript_20820/m.53713 type:complete len:109 (-) Transcript_20820:270-596(-)